jgi:hypothetical protein
MATATKALATEDGQSAQTTQLQAISTAIGNIGLNNIGNLATLTTTDKTSLVGAVNEVNAGLATKADETEVAAIENVYSAKNLLPNTAVTQTINGVTFTPVYDNNGSLLYINANGTATARADYDLYSRESWSKKFEYNKEYFLSGSVNGSPNTFYMRVDGNTTVDAFNYDGDTLFTITDQTKIYNIQCRVMQGYAANNLKFYPMIRDARIKDSTYVPYAMTNRELTERVESNNFGTVVDISSYTSNDYVCPSDGYFQMQDATHVMSVFTAAVIKGAHSGSSILLGPSLLVESNWQSTIVPVKKGMFIRIVTPAASCAYSFIPLN